jgi:ATP-binding cassette subfamily F protein uup
VANIVNLDRVAKAYPAGELFGEISLGLDEADRVGVVGLNGAGKTTLLRLLTGAEESDAGRVTRRRDLRVAALPQSLALPAAATVRDVVLGTAWLPSGFGAEHEWAGDAGVRTVLRGLGGPRLDLDVPIGPMSGGEQRRVALAALLVRGADLLVLDEPTNHLDVAGISWLAGHLAARRTATVVVTHDRWFLDAVCRRIWEVVDGSVVAYDGGYAAWTLARAERARLAAAAEARRQNLLRKEIAWLRRGPPARTSKPKFRIDAANALAADVPPIRDKVSLHRLATARLGRRVFELAGVTVRLGGRPLLDNVSWLVGPGDRIAVVGANGTGKTTLLRTLAGEIEPDTGRVDRGVTVRIGYLSQDLAQLPDRGRVLEAVEDVARRVTLGTRELSAVQLAEVFGFAGAKLRTPVADLSGGERRRLQVLRLLAAEPNVLLLDEPTNDLDIDTLAAMEDLLDGWPGTLVVASHDRYLVERTCDTVVAMFGDGTLRDLPGGVDQYLSIMDKAAEPAGSAAAPGQPAAAQPASAVAATAQQAVAASAQPAAEPGRGRGGDPRAAKKELARLERQLDRLAREASTLHEQLALHATDYEKVAALDTQLREIDVERAATEDAWLALAERLAFD